MIFYLVKPKKRKLNFTEIEMDINEFYENKISSGVSKINDCIYITKELFINFLNDTIYYRTGIIESFFNTQILKKYESKVITDFSNVPYDKRIKVINIETMTEKLIIKYNKVLADNLFYGKDGNEGIDEIMPNSTGDAGDY